jgi:uncharacterized protein YheU (UPF0270 family)
MKIDYHLLKPETLHALMEEYVLREGTDYGEREVSLERKIEQVRKLLSDGKIQLVFDPETESCDLREVSELARTGKAAAAAAVAAAAKRAEAGSE